MSDWNKYGSIKNGRITANLRIMEELILYAGCYEVYNREPVGDKYDQPAEVRMDGKRPTVYVNGVACATIEFGWTRFIGEVKSRGPLKGIGHVVWRSYRGQDPAFVVTLDLEDA